MPVVRTERIFAYGASILTLTAFDPLRSLPAPSYTHAYGIRPVSVNIYARTRIVQHINIYTSDNAECQVDVEKFGSERTERKSDTEQKTTIIVTARQPNLSLSLLPIGPATAQ